MKLDEYALANAGLCRGEIGKLSRCDDPAVQIKLLRKCRFRLLDEIHRKQQSLDAIDYLICKIKEQQ